MHVGCECNVVIATCPQRYLESTFLRSDNVAFITLPQPKHNVVTTLLQRDFVCWVVDSNADSQKIGLWVWAFIATCAYLSSSSCFPWIPASTPTCVRVLIFPQEIYGHGAHHGPKLGVKVGKRLRRSLRRDKNVGLNPAATRNEKTDLGQTPAQKVPQ